MPSGERKGLVGRGQNPDDRRSILLTLTPEGRALEVSTPTLADAFHGCCTGLQPGEAENLAELLRRLDLSLVAWEELS